MKIWVYNGAYDDDCCNVCDGVYGDAFYDGVYDKHVHSSLFELVCSKPFHSHNIHLHRNESLKMRLNEFGLLVTHYRLRGLTL